MSVTTYHDLEITLQRSNRKESKIRSCLRLGFVAQEQSRAVIRQPGNIIYAMNEVTTQTTVVTT